MGTMGRRTQRLKLSADELDSVVGSWGSSPNVEAGPQQHSDELSTPCGQTHGGSSASPTRHIPHISEKTRKGRDVTTPAVGVPLEEFTVFSNLWSHQVRKLTRARPRCGVQVSDGIRYPRRPQLAMVTRS